MKQPSATDSPSFKAIDGSEMGELIAQHIDKAVREVLSRVDGKFRSGMSYPVAQVNAIIRIGLYHDTRNEIPYKAFDVPVRLWTFVRPDTTISGLSEVLQEDVKFSFDVGRSIASAPDQLRENAEMIVLQPQKVGAVVVDTPVGDVTPTDLICDSCQRTDFKSKQSQVTHQRWCRARLKQGPANAEEVVEILAEQEIEEERWRDESRPITK